MDALDSENEFKNLTLKEIKASLATEKQVRLTSSVITRNPQSSYSLEDGCMDDEMCRIR